MRIVSLDTNIIIRVILQDDERQTSEVGRLFAEAARGEVRLQVSMAVLVECIWVLTSLSNLPRDRHAPLLAAVLSLPGVLAEDHGLALRLLKIQRETGLDPVDCYLIARANLDNNLTLATFDRKLRQQVTGDLWPARDA